MVFVLNGIMPNNVGVGGILDELGPVWTRMDHAPCWCWCWYFDLILSSVGGILVWWYFGLRLLR